jgi:DNA-binding transcriptional MerR regulator
LYGEADLLRLQQILFFRELDFSLGEIGDILDDPGFDPLAALESHRQLLEERIQRTNRLLQTIDRTIAKLTESGMDEKVTDEELYAGFTAEQRERYDREVNEQYDLQLVAEANRRVRKMSKARWEALQQEGEEINQSLAALIDRDPGDPEVQALIGRHYAMMNQFFPVSADIYRGLGQLYITNDEFRAFYDRIKPDLADFLQPAMAYYVENTLDKA